MTDRLRHFNTEKQSSSAPRIDFTRRFSQERSESQHRGEKRISATSSSQEAGRPKASSSDPARALAKRISATSSSQEVVRSKASSSDPARALAKLRISKGTEHQRPSGQRPTGTKFSQEIARATSSSFSGRDTRGQRKYDPLLRTQGRRLRGGGDPDETSEQQGEPSKSAKQIYEETVREAKSVANYKDSINHYAYKKHQNEALYNSNASNISIEYIEKVLDAKDILSSTENK
jgi:hypothetical protein